MRLGFGSVLVLRFEFGTQFRFRFRFMSIFLFMFVFMFGFDFRFWVLFGFVSGLVWFGIGLIWGWFGFEF